MKSDKDITKTFNEQFLDIADRNKEISDLIKKVQQDTTLADEAKQEKVLKELKRNDNELVAKLTNIMHRLIDDQNLIDKQNIRAVLDELETFKKSAMYALPEDRKAGYLLELERIKTQFLMDIISGLNKTINLDIEKTEEIITFFRENASKHIEKSKLEDLNKQLDELESRNKTLNEIHQNNKNITSDISKLKRDENLINADLIKKLFNAIEDHEKKVNSLPESYKYKAIYMTQLKNNEAELGTIISNLLSNLIKTTSSLNVTRSKDIIAFLEKNDNAKAFIERFKLNNKIERLNSTSDCIKITDQENENTQDKRDAITICQKAIGRLEKDKDQKTAQIKITAFYALVNHITASIESNPHQSLSDALDTAKNYYVPVVDKNESKKAQLVHPIGAGGTFEKEIYGKSRLFSPQKPISLEKILSWSRGFRIRGVTSNKEFADIKAIAGERTKKRSPVGTTDHHHKRKQ